MSPDERAYNRFFDTERHPVGAYPARAGYYFGAYVIVPIGIATVGMLYNLFTLRGRPSFGPVGGAGREADTLSSPETRSAFKRDFLKAGPQYGDLFGLIIGAPFYLVALPLEALYFLVFGESEDDPEPAHEGW